jgi:hypothetical protein
MLRGYTTSGPPEDCPVLNHVVEPSLADLLRGDILGNAMLLESADKLKGARNIVVSDDKRLVEMVIDVVSNMT